jgi:thioredoxin-related protein
LSLAIFVASFPIIMIMRSTMPLLLVFLLFACGSAQESTAQQGPSLREAQKIAKEAGKFIVLDVYTVWCGYCRQMDGKTYPDPIVQAILSSSYIRVRLNAESKKAVWFNDRKYTEEALAKSMGVSSYPSTIFIDPDGKTIGYQPGFMEAPMFAQLLMYVASGSYQTTPFETFLDKF